MNPVTKEKSKKGPSLSTFDIIVEIYDCVQIFIATLIFGLIIGFAVYYSKPDKSGFTLGIAITATAFVVGIILATKAWKKKGISLFGRGTETNTEPVQQEEPFR